MVNLFGRPCVLFLPANRARAVARAREAGADMVILDLEDAVAPADKTAARDAAVAAMTEAWPCPMSIRVNGIGTEWHHEDVRAAAQSGADLLVVPRAERAADIAGVKAASGKPVAAMIETPLGVRAAWEIGEEAAALIAGTNDLAATLRLPAHAGREPLQTSLQTIVLAARAGGCAAFDGVYNRLDDADGFARQAAEGRRMGFDGKTLIHPDQIAPCRAAWAPGAEELARAERLLSAAKGGAQRFEGEMIERMHVEAAERLLEREKSSLRA